MIIFLSRFQNPFCCIFIYYDKRNCFIVKFVRTLFNLLKLVSVRCSSARVWNSCSLFQLHPPSFPSSLFTCVLLNSLLPCYPSPRTHRCWLGWLTPCSTLDPTPVRIWANHRMASCADGLPPPPPSLPTHPTPASIVLLNLWFRESIKFANEQEYTKSFLTESLQQ